MGELDGAGGTCCAGAGGYTGGTGDADNNQSENGLAGSDGIDTTGGYTYAYFGGGGYFSGGTGIDTAGLDRSILALGGFGNQGHWSYSHMAGDGGTAGSGGTIKVSSNANVYAYNGNLYTDGTDYLDGLNQCPIYAQKGIITAKYSYTLPGNSTVIFTLNLKTAQSTIATTDYSNSAYDGVSDDYRYITKNDVLSNVDMSTQGVGSGAGYIEVSNGTYTVYDSMN